MKTLGIEITDNEPTYGWESIQPETVPNYVQEANRKYAEAEEAWHMVAEQMCECGDDYELFKFLQCKLNKVTRELSQAENNRIKAVERWHEERKSKATQAINRK